jgi:predicted Fe-S protein YdhL (DUF1289 family)
MSFTFCDLYEDVYGVRPGEDFWVNWQSASDSERRKIWDDLVAAQDAKYGLKPDTGASVDEQ